MWTLNRWSATWGSPPHWWDFCTRAPIILSWTRGSQPVAVRNSHCNGPVTWLHAAPNGRALALKRPCTETHSHNHNETWHGLLAGWHSNLEASWPLLSLLPRLVSTVWLWKGHSLEPVSVSFFFSLVLCVVCRCGWLRGKDSRFIRLTCMHAVQSLQKYIWGLPWFFFFFYFIIPRFKIWKPFTHIL